MGMPPYSVSGGMGMPPYSISGGMGMPPYSYSDRHLKRKGVRR
jgi:hypothetical protein